MEITLHRPAALPLATLDAVHRLLLAGGEVEPRELEERLAKVVALALLRDGETVLGVAAIKPRRPRYAAKVAAASGFDLGDRRRELGYVHVVPALRGKGWGRRLVAVALAGAGGEPLYATTRADNPAIAGILRRFGFRPVGRPWRSSRRGRGPLMLWATADWRARQPGSRWASIGRRLGRLARQAPPPPTALLLSLGGEDWTAIRLAGAMKRAGFDIAIAAPARSLPIESRHADRLVPFGIPGDCAWRLRLRLRRIMAAAEPAVVVPVNHRAIAFVHHVAATLDRRPEAVAAGLRRSLGDPATIADRLLKHRTLAVARSVGVPVPVGGTAATVEEAIGLARAVGFPAVLKASFGAGGNGVAVCRSPAEVETAFPHLAVADPARPQRAGPRWLPAPLPIDVQAFVDGTPAMSSAVAKDGQVLAVLSAIAIETAGANGPATVVRLMHHPEIEAMTAAMVGAFGASGFASFDFLIDRRTSEPCLVECNPRPIGITPLGALVGCDLVAAFRAFVDGAAAPPATATARSEATVALFPRALVRDPPSAYLRTGLHDVPTDEPAAVARFLEKRGLSLDPLPPMLEAAE